MKPEEAIKNLKLMQAAIELDYPMDYAAAFDMAIEALEKQIPKKPIKPDGLFYKCPICKNFIGNYNRWYCTICGHKLDWWEGES